MDGDVVSWFVCEVCFDFILNCIGVLIRGFREYLDNVILINVWFFYLFKKLLDEVGVKLIYISMDCVFFGKKGNYLEIDFWDVDDVYGCSKVFGEIINDKDLIICIFIIGFELKENGEGLFYWFMYQYGCVNGFQIVIWGGVIILELVKVIDVVIDQGVIGLI